MDATGIFNIPNGETPDQAAQRKQRIAAMALSQGAPQNIGQGLASIGESLLYRSQQHPQDQFPTAPTTQPDGTPATQNLFSPLKNWWTGNQNGGLY